MQLGNSGVEAIEELPIFIDAEGDRTFVQMADGPATGFRIPFSREQVESTLNSYSPTRVATDPLASLGTTLFLALFQGPHGRELWQRMAQAERVDHGLRLRICSDVERTQHLPWELLFDPSRRDFVSLSGRVALVRTRGRRFRNSTPPLPLPQLRVLAVEADVTGNMRTGEDIAILKRLATEYPSRIALTTIVDATPDSLSAALSRDKYDVFHFAGTGEVLPFVSRRGGLRQALKLFGTTTPAAGSNEPDPDDDDDAGSLVDRQDLGKMLKRAEVRLAVLNACHTDWIARSLAKYIPAAIGISELVSVETALALAESLYRSVAAGNAIDFSVTGARQAVDRASPGNGDWCKIIFYMQEAHGEFLLQPPSAEPAAAVPQAALGASKEVLKLTRLAEVYERNLATLERAAAAGSGSNVTADAQIADLRQRRELLSQQLAALRLQEPA